MRRPEARKLIIGLHGAVCIDCVDVCAQVIAEEPADPPSGAND
jgi:hypothetical protein